ncbi:MULTISPECIES: hypothetical protein [Rufibacter]|uniref:Outer membrane protein beta-barrel domain-containing protein n=1 Tax=Rufibacter quisquiliarum TaxID=1549639 RepID=A0A839GFZ0_9BACT|nr:MULTISPECIES: hypothetical protein [Rufibacter]MBA9077460.1 hypothetical protein [Rufibacter quisquiliarum]
MAQENRGTLIPAKIIQRSVMVGGSITGAYRDVNNNFGSQEISSSEQQFDFDVKAGYFILHDVAIGGRATLNHTRTSTDGGSDTRQTYLLVGPFVRYYLNNGIFGEASYSVGKNNEANSRKTNISELKGGIGYAMFINPKVAIEPAIMVARYKEKRASGGENSYLTKFGPSLNLGLQIYLFRERKLALLR